MGLNPMSAPAWTEDAYDISMMTESTMPSPYVSDNEDNPAMV